MREEWKNFKEGDWTKEINVSDFIQKTMKHMMVMNLSYLVLLKRQKRFGIFVNLFYRKNLKYMYLTLM